MLKSLELIGFKSFADRVRFEFGAGVTGVVGPNGSGKSNVVDGLKWILGEQSARGLRGKEMTDVVFNGCATRKPMGMAEASLVFDNSKRTLAHAADEIVLTRRVYRDGQSEYYINGQAALLRDFKELLLGTGVGLGAYSVIEQGKVDQVLSASNYDRRQLLEEAAGVSRFKAKKVEALRRLERVEQNLVRARDIRDELEKQQRSLRAQAGKARSYREYTDRLRELRIAVALAEFGAGSGEADALATEAAEIEAGLGTQDGALVEALAARDRIESQLAELEAQTVQRTAARAEARRRALSKADELAVESRRAAEFEVEISDRRARLHALRRRAHELVQQARQWEAQIAHEREDFALRSQESASRQAQHAELAATAAPLRLRVDAGLENVRSLQRDADKCAHDAVALGAQREEVAREAERIDRRRAELVRQLSTGRTQRGDFQRQLTLVRAELRRSRVSVGGVQHEHRALAAERAELARVVAETRDRRTALASRSELLRQWQERREGLDNGVQQALQLRWQKHRIWMPVIGLLAEFLEVESEHADLVEVALGPLAQALLVRSHAELGADLVAAARQLPGRVRLLAASERDGDRLVVFPDDLGTSLATLVDVDDSLRPLVDRLLGNVILARSFADAQRLRERAPDLRIVTATGEVFEPDGSIGAGPARSSAGIIARQAEIRDLARQIDAVERLLGEQQESKRRVEETLAALDMRLSEDSAREATLASQERHFDAVVRQHRQQNRALEGELAELEADRLQIAEAQTRLTTGQKARAEEGARLRSALEAATSELVGLESELAALEDRMRVAEGDRGAEAVALAVVEERLAALLQRQRQFAEDAVARRDEIAEESARLAEVERRAELVADRRLELASAHADAVAELDRTAPESDAEARRAEAATQRRTLDERAKQARAAADELRRRQHRVEIRRTELRLQLDSTAARLREDYGIDLVRAFRNAEPLAADFDLDAARTEADALRQKIARLGAVNVQAVEHLEEIDGRLAALDLQVADLTGADRRLREIVAEINVESARLFTETYTAVRRHFQQLFRRLFGGGKADLLLEDERDVLESPIEIVARPPGKEPRSLSLLSGGEKTMTAAALLMALFRSKPSPFCILDEVDAALDEANISRFMEGLREFLSDTQFILITHSKTTMASADVLHGVTQRESGVSIRVSVKLEDVADDGSIREDAGRLAA